MNGCPNDTPACRQRSYVIPGDTVLTGKVRGPYVCAFMPNRVGGSAGWVRRDRLSALPVAKSPPLSAWTGDWADGDDTIRLRVKSDALVGEGEAYWPGLNTDYPGGVHEGEFSATAAPKANRVVFRSGFYGGADDKDACLVTLNLVGSFLIASDNGNCGGANVRFSGVYSRRRLRR